MPWNNVLSANQLVYGANQLVYGANQLVYGFSFVSLISDFFSFQFNIRYFPKHIAVCSHLSVGLVAGVENIYRLFAVERRGYSRSQIRH